MAEGERTTASSPGHSTVVLVGRLTSAPEENALPSGDVLVRFRVSVPRGPTPLARGSRQRSDWVDCVSTDGRCRRSARSWSVGDTVEVTGVLRRRFLRDGAGAGPAGSRLEVEALRVRRA